MASLAQNMAQMAQSPGHAVAAEDTEHLLRNAIHEIRGLRHRNEILEAKVGMIELFSAVLHAQVTYAPTGASPDVAHALERKIEELREARQQTKTP